MKSNHIKTFSTIPLLSIDSCQSRSNFFDENILEKRVSPRSQNHNTTILQNSIEIGRGSEKALIGGGRGYSIPTVFLRVHRVSFQATPLLRISSSSIGHSPPLCKESTVIYRTPLLPYLCATWEMTDDENASFSYRSRSGAAFSDLPAIRFSKMWQDG